MTRLVAFLLTAALPALAQPWQSPGAVDDASLRAWLADHPKVRALDLSAKPKLTDACMDDVVKLTHVTKLCLHLQPTLGVKALARVGAVKGVRFFQLHDSPGHRMASYEELRARPGIIWPYVDGRETKWRYNADYDPAADPALGFDFYGKPDHRAWIWLRPYEPAAEEPDDEYPFWLCTGRVIEPVCQCCSMRPVFSTIGYSSSGSS